MAPPETDNLPLPQQLALNYAPRAARGATRALFAFDHRLANLVSKTTEPLLGQMRLAWWRDQLRLVPAARAAGDPVLDALGECWAGEETALLALIDGWEHLLAEPPLPEDAMEKFAAGRGAAFGGLARILGTASAQVAATGAGHTWALADLAASVTDAREVAATLSLARVSLPKRARLPRNLRPLAILRGLALRAIGRGGGPLIAGRADILATLRLGMFGH